MVNLCLYACIPINKWSDKKFNHNIDVDTQYNIVIYGFSIITLRRHSEKRSVAIKYGCLALMATGSEPVTESIEGALVEGIMEELRNNRVIDDTKPI